MGFKETEISLLFNPCSIYSFMKLQDLAQEQLRIQELVSLHFLCVTDYSLTGQGIYSNFLVNIFLLTLVCNF